MVSIHTLVKSVTVFGADGIFCRVVVSIHTLVKSVTAMLVDKDELRVMFQSTRS